jgi:aspyridone synthetase trans-acting enoyl reductase
VPEIREDEILVKINAVALNPSDVKSIQHAAIEGTVGGSDLAGTVVMLGKGVGSRLKIGDRVSTFVFGGSVARPDNGAFAEYAVAKTELCLRLPDATSFTEAASWNISLVTCGLAFRSLGLIDDFGEITAATPTSIDPTWVPILVYGGSTATGTIALQLLRHLGFETITTCSPHNFALVQKAGAQRAFDYAQTTCGHDMWEFCTGGLRYAIDCIGDTASTSLCYRAIGSKGGRYVSLNPFPKRLALRRRDISVDWVLGYSVFGGRVQLSSEYQRDEAPEDVVFAGRWMAKMEKLIQGGDVVAHPIDLRDGGLASIIDDADMLRAGSVSGKKLVYVIG